MHEVLPKKIGGSVSRYRATAGLRPEKRSSPTQGLVAIRRARACHRAGRTMTKNLMTLAVALASLPALASAQDARSQAPPYCFDLTRVIDLAMTKRDLPRSPAGRGRAAFWIRAWCWRIGRIARSTAPRPIPATLRRWTRRRKPRRRARQSSIKSNLVLAQAGPKPTSGRLPATSFCTTPRARFRSR